MIRILTTLLGVSVVLANAGAQTITPSLPRFHQYSDNLATAGQPSNSQFSEIRQAGYELVINLSPANLPGAPRNEQQLVESAGMKYVHIPVDWDKPSLDDLSRFFDIMDRNKDHKVLVHCWLNARSSAFVYSFRTLRESMSDESEREVLTKIWNANRGFELHAAPQWLELLNAARQRFAK